MKVTRSLILLALALMMTFQGSLAQDATKSPEELEQIKLAKLQKREAAR